MKQTILILFSVILALSLPSCKGDTTTIKNLESNQVDRKTQALLLTQRFEFDVNDKNRMTGSYEQRSKITVPSDLSPQNKWIMFEGPVLENDLVAYRYYADSRHRCDIYGKIVGDLVMDTVSWDYHDLMDWGSDILKVGNSLGLGSPAIHYQDTIYTLSDYDKKTIEVLSDDNNSSAVRTTFTGLRIGDKKFDLLQDWNISAGHPSSEITLSITNGSLPDGMYFATGFVKHLPEVITGETPSAFYALNWGMQSFHDQDLGMAVMAKKEHGPEIVPDDLSHVMVFKNAKQKVTYKFMSVWEKDLNKITDIGGFKKIVKETYK